MFIEILWSLDVFENSLAKCPLLPSCNVELNPRKTLKRGAVGFSFAERRLMQGWGKGFFQCPFGVILFPQQKALIPHKNFCPH